MTVSILVPAAVHTYIHAHRAVSAYCKNEMSKIWLIAGLKHMILSTLHMGIQLFLAHLQPYGHGFCHYYSLTT